jgi:Zinc carboxypeptidase
MPFALQNYKSKIGLFFCFLITFTQSFAQTKSPSEYFGYDLGSTFHRHHQMVEYVDYLVGQNGSKAKIIEYGKTTENRKLFVVAISSSENVNQLENIRQNNLKSIGLLDGMPSQKQPAIAWLSYNVHGNEAVSMEASMEVMYRLLKNNGGEYDAILSNSVIIIDPCINPDGRDRYANWYNQKVGVTPEANPLSVEHAEPWPGGRTNHYLFDLNRDWAWLVQDESKQRMALYNSWMPHLHADFHEQGVNSPYYFAPAAKPYHEDITAWQREFQQKVGQYNKKEFDKNGWLYFSNERFDLLYPSYGDTYPTLNGAFGMTYEQGGIRGGLAYELLNGDTLTLKQRISHHVATSFAAITALADNADKNVTEFIKYFEKSKNNPDGVYQTYVLKTKDSETKVEEFANHMDKLGIQYGMAGKNMMATGYSYQEYKQKGFTIEPSDMILSMNQPKSKLLKVLMEPKSTVEDSMTYDITAWAMPYAYGLKAFALKEKLTSKKFEFQKNASQINAEKKPYAYIFKWNSFTDARFLASLLKKKVKVRHSEAAFEIDGKAFEKGTLIVTRTSNESFGANFEKIIIETANSFNLPVFQVFTGMVSKGYDFGSENVTVIKSPKIAIVGGENADSNAFGEVWHFFDKQIQYPATVINSEVISNNSFTKFDVLIFPRGNFNRIINEYSARNISEWVKTGGKLILMENSNSAFADRPGFEIKRKEAKKDTAATQKIYENREREELSEDTPGSIYALTMDNSHPLAFGYDKTYYSLVLQVSDYQLLKTGWNVGIIKGNDLVAGFSGKKAQEKLKNSLIFGVEESRNGQIVYMINNPLFRGFWQNGKLLFANAVFGF